MGKRALLVIAMVAALLVALPSLASAAWLHKGKGELKENASVTLSGELTLATAAGDVSCATEIGTTLTASSSAGHVNSFTVSKPSECDLTGSLAAICGTHGLTKVEKTGTWSLTADESDITLSSVDVHYVLAGCLIPSFRLKGSATLSLDKASAIGKVTFSGTQTLYNSVGEESGSGELKGGLSASPAGTYGVNTAPTVETGWTMGNSHLSEDGKLTLSGTFSFSGSGGSVSCPATVKLSLESSTVAEEEPEGEVEAFTVSEPSKCDITGGYASSPCATNRITEVQQTGTATLFANEEDFVISGLTLDYKFKECPISSLRVEGSPTVSVSNPESIASATFGAGSLQVYNSENEKTGTAEAGGSASASPSGTYQLATDTAETEATEHEKTTEEDTITISEGSWTVGGAGIGETTETGTPITIHDSLSLTRNLGPSLGVTHLGPCQVQASGRIWNPKGVGHGEINLFTMEAPCPITADGLGGAQICTIEEATSNTATPWTIAVAGTNVSIEGFNVGYVFSENCPLGAEVGFSGTATGVFSGSSIGFLEAGDLFGSYTLNGSLELTP